MYSLEEFPPPKRTPPNAKAAKKKKGGQPRPGGPLRLPGPLVVAAIATVVVILAGSGLWVERRISTLEAELARTRTGLDDAGASLRLLWTTTTRLDESQGQRQDVLRDSLEFVRDYVESEVGKLWRTAYTEHQSRLDRNARSIAQQGESIAKLLDATSQASARLDAFSRRFTVQDGDLRGLRQAIDGLRQTTLTLADQYSGMERDIVAERAARLLVDGRLQGVEQWYSGFRSEGLTGKTLQTRIASLVTDLRSVGQRLDSLRFAVDSMRVGTRVGVMGPAATVVPDRKGGN